MNLILMENENLFGLMFRNRFVGRKLDFNWKK